MHRLSSSLRTRSAAETLKYAMEIAPRLGITRVTDTTWLDRIGIPVYASIRPAAATGSLCVNAGKGLHDIEAKIGAYMESIEFAYAEFNDSKIPIIRSSPAEILASYNGRIDFVDLCPLMDRTILAEELMMAVCARDLLDTNEVLLPAELIFIPFHSELNRKVFGQSSNGLCSGNTTDEAIVHGLCELMERDVQAFNFIYDRSALVDLDCLSPEVTSLIRKIKNAGLIISIRHTESSFGFAYFQAFLMEAHPESPISIAIGSGLHLIKEVALVRAICEAAQSRLSHIHGGRDDLIERAKYFERLGRPIELQAIYQLRNDAQSPTKRISYSTINDSSKDIRSIADALGLIIRRLQAYGLKSICFLPLTPNNSPIQVVRVVVPSLESFDPSLKRIGPRLGKYVSDTK
ncbi:YcaO-like family protein [Glaciimonas immobilis]|uniref:Ribosomal protein S12 methylthiotransferase accessory factor n=1 Tax=Glaciimonas immobilis TaxID=728004 RepID=A0A840RPD9_9BURK|nr:YcaO-like family protein [Glaciimonas immobilis]KAF3996845.1 hypothetical protein HAV38_16805 [Glaciimonas immobilis]MBB5199603.1 ribosomal protein S12 methylthiotransferase accessory factor [Glaciimonas immobilis]